MVCRVVSHLYILGFVCVCMCRMCVSVREILAILCVVGKAHTNPGERNKTNYVNVLRAQIIRKIRAHTCAVFFCFLGHIVWRRAEVIIDGEKREAYN